MIMAGQIMQTVVTHSSYTGTFLAGGSHIKPDTKLTVMVMR